MEAALQRGDLGYIRNVELDVLLNYRAKDGRSALQRAVAENQLDCCREIYRRCPSLLYTQTNKHRFTVLHDAANQGNPEIVKFLISVGENKLLSILDINDTPVLNMAADGGKLEAAKVLIEAEPKMVGMVNAYGYSPMHCAVRNHNLEMVKLLVEADPNVEYFADYIGNIPILMAIRQAHSAGNASASAKIRTLLLKMQPSQGKAQIGDDGWTPLHHAAYEGDLCAIDDIIRFCPGSWEEVDYEGQNFVHLAAKHDIVKVVKYILETKETALSALNAQDYGGNTPLHLAALNRNETTALCLLYDPNVNKATVNNQGKHVLDSITFDYDKRKVGVSDRLDQKDLKEQSGFDLVVGALIAIVSFTVGITVPVGYNSDGPDKEMVVLSKQISFEAFVISNCLALVFSLYAVFSHFCTRRLQKEEDVLHQLGVATFCTLSAIFAMMVAFITGSYAVLGNSTRLSMIIFVICGCFFISTCHPMRKVLRQ